MPEPVPPASCLHQCPSCKRNSNLQCTNCASSFESSTRYYTRLLSVTRNYIELYNHCVDMLNHNDTLRKQCVEVETVKATLVREHAQLFTEVRDLRAAHPLWMKQNAELRATLRQRDIVIRRLAPFEARFEAVQSALRVTRQEQKDLRAKASGMVLQIQSLHRMELTAAQFGGMHRELCEYKKKFNSVECARDAAAANAAIMQQRARTAEANLAKVTDTQSAVLKEYKKTRELYLATKSRLVIYASESEERKQAIARLTEETATNQQVIDALTLQLRELSLAKEEETARLQAQILDLCTRVTEVEESARFFKKRKQPNQGPRSRVKRRRTQPPKGNKCTQCGILSRPCSYRMQSRDQIGEYVCACAICYQCRFGTGYSGDEKHCPFCRKPCMGMLDSTIW